MSEYRIVNIGYRRYICKENEDPISAEALVDRLNELEQRLAAAETILKELKEHNSYWWQEAPEISDKIDKYLASTQPNKAGEL